MGYFALNPLSFIRTRGGLAREAANWNFINDVVSSTGAGKAGSGGDVSHQRSGMRVGFYRVPAQPSRYFSIEPEVQQQI